MKVIGITGRSGCGKSTVTRWLAEQGVPCIDADLIAREVLYPGSPCLDQLQQRFGADILDEDGTRAAACWRIAPLPRRRGQPR